MREFPGALTIAEESTAWPMVSRPAYLGGLGFSMKWNMGWMNDTLAYMQQDPVHRRYHHDQLTFGQLYAYTENFVLPLLARRGGARQGLAARQDAGRRLAAVRQPAPAAHLPVRPRPGKKLSSWATNSARAANGDASGELDWGLLQHAWHAGMQRLARDLNRLYRDMPALHDLDFDAAGFPLDRLPRRRPVGASASCAAPATAASWSSCSTSRRCRATATASACPRPAATAKCSTATRVTTAAATSATAAGSMPSICLDGPAVLRRDHFAAAGRRDPAAGMKVLFATSEAAPLVKTGGLADVSGALPAALRNQGVDVRVLLPGYGAAARVGRGVVRRLLPPSTCRRSLAVRLLAASLPGSGVPLLISIAPQLYRSATAAPTRDRSGTDWPDNDQRFALLSRVAAHPGSMPRSPLDLRPDILHCNDWQSGLAPAYLHFMPGKKAATVMTIHNLAFQGIFPPTTCCRRSACRRQASASKGWNTTAISRSSRPACTTPTTSPRSAPPTPAKSSSEPLGFGMQGLLAQRARDLTGIVNGIDTGDWNPAADPHLAQPYDAGHLAGKAANKRALQEQHGAGARPGHPAARHDQPHHPSERRRPAAGDRAATAAVNRRRSSCSEPAKPPWKTASATSPTAHPDKVGATIGFDEGLSHLIEAGADMFLMPSRFEPCGLNQMYSQRYGTRWWPAPPAGSSTP